MYSRAEPVLTAPSGRSVSEHPLNLITRLKVHSDWICALDNFVSRFPPKLKKAKSQEGGVSDSGFEDLQLTSVLTLLLQPKFLSLVSRSDEYSVR